MRPGQCELATLRDFSAMNIEHMQLRPAAAVRPFSAGSNLNIRSVFRHGMLGITGFVLLSMIGCTTPAPTDLSAIPHDSDSQTLRAGDVVKISFPRAPTLDTTQQIRRDGKLNLYLIGEVQAADLTPADFEKQLMDKYAEQLVSKEVRVTVVQSAFAIYVAGAVLRPGRITPDRELSPIEAIMEAGGFDMQKANLKAVEVIRRDGAKTQNFVLNLQSVLDGKQAQPFYLRRNDIIYVPEKRSIF